MTLELCYYIFVLFFPHVQERQDVPWEAERRALWRDCKFLFPFTYDLLTD